jgi:hypothetical protein
MTEVREPTSIVEMAEMCRRAQPLVKNMKGVTQEDIETAEDMLAVLAECDFYELDGSIGQAVDQVYEQTYDGKTTDDVVLDVDCRLPSNVCAFWSTGSKITFSDGPSNLPFMYLGVVDPAGSGKNIIYLISPYFGAMFMGSYQVGVEQPLRISGHALGLSDAAQQFHTMHVLTVATTCSILNQPSFTKREPAGSRQERRAAKRSGSYATDAWHKISWNIGEAVKAKLTRDEPTRCMPLHYTRGHWRKAEEGWNNVERRKDGLWYQWIEGYWSGHPAFGIKRSYHAPKLAKGEEQ